MSNDQKSSNNPMVAFKNEMAKLEDQIPTSSDIPKDKMKSAIFVAVQKNPKLLAADRSTLWLSVRQCAADGLLPDGREAALVIFKTKINDEFVDAVQYIPMVFGLRKRAMKSGHIQDINAVIVYAGEFEHGRFTYVEGDEPKITHRPILLGVPGEPDRGEPIGAYAVATFKDGHKVRDFVNAEDIERIRRAAASQKVFAKGKKPTVSDEPIGAWAEWWDEFWKKSAVRRVSKKLPMSSDDQRIIQESDTQRIKDVTPQDSEAVSDESRLSFSERAALARSGSLPIDEVSDAETIEAEATPEQNGKATEKAKPTPKSSPKNNPDKAVDGDHDYFQEGRDAHASGKLRNQCPYPPGGKDHDIWTGGWDAAMEEGSNVS